MPKETLIITVTEAKLLKLRKELTPNIQSKAISK
jgi:hypothetical protein